MVLKLKKIFKKLNKIKNVEGRLHLIRTLPNKSKIFLDYAHTPEALEKAIISLREHFNKKITILFGCGGERDKTKRKLMGQVAKSFVIKFMLPMIIQEKENAKKIRKRNHESFKKVISNRNWR